MLENYQINSHVVEVEKREQMYVAEYSLLHIASILKLKLENECSRLKSGIVFETVQVEYSPGDSFIWIAYVKQSWTCAVVQNSLFCTVLPVFETVPVLLLLYCYTVSILLIKPCK